MNKQTITLNNRSYPYSAGMTISSLMAENNFDFPSIIVKINGDLINDEDWQSTPVSTDDNVEIIHIFGGG